jgi:putative membrane protein
MKRTAVMLALGMAGALAASGAMAQNSGMTNNTARTKPADKASKSFIKDAIEGDIAEVDVGKLAQEKGQSQGVKDFGAMLIKDHSEHKAKAEEVASQIGVKPPTSSSMTEKATYAKLKLLSGTSFDTAFAKAMVKDHQQDIKEFQKETAKSDPAGKLAQETLPVLHKHLEAAQQLAARQKQSSR